MSNAQNTVVPVCPQLPTSTFNISEAIVEQMPMAERVAKRIYFKCCRLYELDDLIGYANLGLVQAAKRYRMSDAVGDFAELAERYAKRLVCQGVGRLARFGLRHWRMIKRGQMQRPKVDSGVPEFVMSDALEVDPSDWGRDEPPATTDTMIAWLRTQDPAVAEIVELRVKGGLSITKVAAKLGQSRSSVNNRYYRAVNVLRKQFNRTAWQPFDVRTRREQTSQAAAE
jgi:RNA polymerase sigma factor (sigma-70 family)